MEGSCACFANFDYKEYTCTMLMPINMFKILVDIVALQ